MLSVKNSVKEWKAIPGRLVSDRKDMEDWIEDLEVQFGVVVVSRRSWFSLTGGDLGVRMAEMDYGGLERFQIQLDEGLDFICGRKQDREEDWLWGFSFPASPGNLPCRAGNLCLLLSRSPCTHSLLCPLHIIPCSSSCTFRPPTVEGVGEEREKESRERRRAAAASEAGLELRAVACCSGCTAEQRCGRGGGCPGPLWACASPFGRWELPWVRRFVFGTRAICLGSLRPKRRSIRPAAGRGCVRLYPHYRALGRSPPPQAPLPGLGGSGPDHLRAADPTTDLPGWTLSSACPPRPPPCSAAAILLTGSARRPSPPPWASGRGRCRGSRRPPFSEAAGRVANGPERGPVRCEAMASAVVLVGKSFRLLIANRTKGGLKSD